MEIKIEGIHKTWLITGVAGFIGSHLLEFLLGKGQKVVGIDNFLTGKKENIETVLGMFPPSIKKNFSFIEGDITNPTDCDTFLKRGDVVLHQAALGSVPRSIRTPFDTHVANVNGFFMLLNKAREKGITRVVYASSSSVYGDSSCLPKKEEQIGNPLSPYAVTKYVNELYANVFHRCYGMETIGLRYFNVFGPRQDPNGAYAAVMPRWIDALLHGKEVYINGDGETTRDFCYVKNAVDANIKAALTVNTKAFGRAYNIAFGEQTSLNKLFQMMQTLLNIDRKPTYIDFREGDIRHSCADIKDAEEFLEYSPCYSLQDGLREYVTWVKREYEGVQPLRT